MNCIGFHLLLSFLMLGFNLSYQYGFITHNFSANNNLGHSFLKFWALFIPLILGFNLHTPFLDLNFTWIFC